MWSISKLFEKTAMPVGAVQTVNELLARIGNCGEYKALYDYTIGCGEDFSKLSERINEVSELLGTDERELALALLCDASKVWHDRFLEKGYGEDLFYEACLDLKYKALECKNNHGKYGLMPISWYGGFFGASRLQLGRLQYECTPFRCERFCFEDAVITKGQTAINLHIPSAGALTSESVDASLRIASQKYAQYAIGGVLFFVCHSWLLFPPYRAVFGSSNTGAFIDRFTILDVCRTSTFSDAWRVFNMPFDGDVSLLPSDTSMRRGFIQYLSSSSDFGNGYGVFGLKV